MLLRRKLGDTGLEVTALGLGGGQVGDESLDEQLAGRLLNEVLDAGVTLIDTARGYGLSEERIGRHISHRRHEYVLSTKVGYDIEGLENWTRPIISAGVERALRLLRTDVIDIVHLHSCPLEVLENNGVVEALVSEKEKGNIRVAAYSGENEDLAWAVKSGVFGSVQTSVNITDQLSLGKIVPEALSKGMGVIGKRPIANAPWRFPQKPIGAYAEEYWTRWKQMQVDAEGMEWNELFLRFAAFAPGVTSVIVGTSNPEHFKRNLEIIGKGPLPDRITTHILAAYRAVGDAWTGQV